LFGDDLSPSWGEHSGRIELRSEGDIFYLKHRLGAWLAFHFQSRADTSKRRHAMNKIYYILRVMFLNTLIHLSFGREIQTMSDLLMPSMFITALTTFIDVYYGEDLEQTFCNIFSLKASKDNDLESCRLLQSHSESCLEDILRGSDTLYEGTLRHGNPGTASSC
jgi:hypothetical protein